MCTRYIPPEVAEIERFWSLPRGYQPDLWPREMFPRAPGPFIRRRRDATFYERELVVGRWGLIPERSETSTPRKKDGKLLNTENARGEEVHWKDSYKGPWARGQRCIIPAFTFDEPNWETGKNVWWRFRRADGAPWGLASRRRDIYDVCCTKTRSHVGKRPQPVEVPPVSRVSTQ